MAQKGGFVVEDIKELQALHLTEILRETRTTQTALAALLSVSKQTVWNWTHGRTRISDADAAAIHERWPQYSIEWLRGYTPYKGREEVEAAELEALRQAFEDMERENELRQTLEAALVLLHGWSAKRTTLEHGGSHVPAIALEHDGGTDYMPFITWARIIDKVSDYFAFEVAHCLELSPEEKGL